MKACIWSILLYAGSTAFGQILNSPPRATNAPSGSELIQRLTPLDLKAREEEIFAQVAAGNVPAFLRRLCPVTVTNVAEDRASTVTFFVTPDYLAVGSDADYFLAPLTPATAQRIADFAGCALPTRKIVNVIYAAAAVKLAPSPMQPGPQMTTVPEFAKHNSIVRTQRAALLPSAPLGALVAGHKKDVVISAKLATATNKVAIYGWHQTNGAPMQPLYLGHTAAWADYSHGIRLVQQQMFINGRTQTVAEVLGDANLAGLLSDEGVVAQGRYPTNELPVLAATTYAAPKSPKPVETAHRLSDFKPSPHFDEQLLSFSLDPDVKIHINAPPRETFNQRKPVLLIFYGLPNGNTTAQTIGKVMQPGDDWHFDIQHIGAQTRFLRQLVTSRAVVVAYLEAASRSWPAWWKANGDNLIPRIVASVKNIFADYTVEIVLSGHSGGGSFTFGFLNAVDRIPDNIVRIAFLDSNYAYDPARGHKDKLVQWLKASDRHFLSVLAYNDAVALLDGKPFVSAAGGSWGRSHAMLNDLASDFRFTSVTNAGLQQHTALDGRIQFLLKENPERKIFHTVQVERNGFIHGMVIGTPNQGKGYEYFGHRAYAKWITGN